MGEILREIRDAYADMVNKPFTGYYDGEHTFTHTTGNARKVICFKGDNEFERLAKEAIRSVSEIEQRRDTKIWKGVVGDWMFNLYIAPESNITEEAAVAGNRFEVYEVQAVQIRQELIRRWPFVCNLYVRALPPAKSSAE